MKLKDIILNDKGNFLIFAPKQGHRYLIANGNQIIRPIFIDENTVKRPWKLPFDVLIPFFERVYTFPFTWKALMPESEAEKRGLKPLLTYEKNVKTKDEEKDTISVQKMCLVIRTKDNQHYLRDRETQPFELAVLSSDGSEVKFVFKYLMQIEDNDGMEKVLTKFPAGNFFSHVEDKIKKVLSVTLQKRKLGELRGVARGGISKELKTIIKNLNKSFKDSDFGFSLLDILHEEIIILSSTSERISEEQNTEIERSRAAQTAIKAEAEANKIRTTETAKIDMQKKRTMDVGTAEALVLDKKLRYAYDYEEARSELVDGTANAVSGNLKDLKGVLITKDGISNGSNNLATNLIANAIQTHQEGGSHVD
jgi:hypothetical protein